MFIARPTESTDIPALKLVLDGTALFPGDLLPALLDGFLTGTESEDVWLSCEVDGEAIGFCYAAPEMLTDRTWNMLAIAVLPSKQGHGAGSVLINELEANLRERDGRIVIADTSGSDEYSKTRKFYQSNGYAEEARIRDFWSAGDDKVTFWKSLR